MTAGPSEFGTELRRLRLASGLSQESLAERAQITARAVGALETGTRRAPYRETVELLLTALDAAPKDRAHLEELADRARPRGARPALGAAPTRASNVVLPETRLIGRDTALDVTADLLAQHRFVTLTGTGGVGKTRVALGVASNTATRFDGGVWFVYLSALSNSDSIALAVAEALHVPQKTSDLILDSIAHALGDRAALIVLDNCEHVIHNAAEFVPAMLRKAPHLRILATSREPLRTGAEITYALEPLEYPGAAAPISAQTAGQYSAIELFIERARSRDPFLRLGDGDAEIVARIVRRLDGLPLAIELAAARVRALGLAGIERALDHRFEILSSGDRTAPVRQQTLRAAIDWSYELLSDDERLLFRRLAIFSGSWSLDAAQDVCNGTPLQSAVGSLASLVDKSLASPIDAVDSIRYRFLESTRAFALEKSPPDEHETIAMRHAQWMATVVRQADDRIATEGAATRLAPITPEVDNIRAALAWCERSGHWGIAAVIVSRLADFFYWRGLSEEGLRWIARVLQHLDADADGEEIVRLLCGRARLTGDGAERLSSSERAVELADRTGSIELRGMSFMRLAVALYALGRLDAAVVANDRALEQWRLEQRRPNLRLAWTLQHRSWILTEQGDASQARRCIEEAIAIFSSAGATLEACGLQGDLAELEFAEGNAERALELIDEAIAGVVGGGDIQHESIFTCNRAGYLLRLGDYTEAEATAREAVALAVSSHAGERALHALEHLAATLAARSALDDAARLAGYVQSRYSESGYQRETTERSSHELLVASLNGAFAQDELARLLRSGAVMTQAAALEIACAA